MKFYFLYFISLVLFTLPTFANADEIDRKYSIEARYVYTFGYRAGQSLAKSAQAINIDRVGEGFRDYLQQERSGSKPDQAEQNRDNSDYLTGYRMAQSLIAQGLRKPDSASLVQGLSDSMNGNTPDMTEVEMNDALSSYLAYQKALRRNDAQANMADAEAFLAKNRKRGGVIEMPSGLQYQVIVPAQGIQPGPRDTVRIHYHGTFADGEVFDSSLRRGQPAVFRVDQVVAGFSEALSNMRQGEKWRIFVPPALGYGERGVKGSIAPNQLLIFELELLDIVGRG
jgi:FKBP-type peptidyl-prolyl cis-trans isomerase FklB